MEQAIQAVSVGKSEDMAFNSAHQMNMIGAAGSPHKGENTKSGKEEKDPKVMIPFLQLLNQQMSLLFQQGEKADSKISIDGKTVSPDQINPDESVQGNQNINVTDLLSETANVSDGTKQEILNLVRQLLKMENKVSGSSPVGDKEGKNQILNKSIIKDNAEKAVSLENSPAKSGESKIDKNDSFKNHSNIFNYSEENSNREVDIKAKENISFAAHDAKNHISNRDNQNQNTEFKQTQTKTENFNFAKVESFQTLWADVNETLKTDQKNKIIQPENIIEEISFNSQNATGGTTAKAENVAGVSPTEIINQVANEIKENTGSDGGRIKIILDPPSLGKLEMDVVVRNGKVEVVLIADNKDVQHTLDNHLDQLKSTLQNQGLTVERCDVLMSDRHDEFYRSFSNASYFQEKSGRDGGEEGEETNKEKSSLVTSVEKKTGSILSVDTETDKISLFA